MVNTQMRCQAKSCADQIEHPNKHITFAARASTLIPPLKSSGVIFKGESVRCSAEFHNSFCKNHKNNSADLVESEERWAIMKQEIKDIVNEETLDPEDWKSMRKLGHKMLDEMLDYMKTIRERPVWQHASDRVKAHFNRPLPRDPQSPEARAICSAGLV